MSRRELVSVIVAAYNHERFVADALASLCDQTYDQLELIVVDDGSTDSTFARIEAMRSVLAQRFVRVELQTQPNGGPARAITRCLELARGELVYMLDSDDVALPEAIESLLPLVADPAVALAVGDNDYIDEKGAPLELDSNGRRFSSFVSFHTQGRRDFLLERDFGTYASLIAGNYVPNGWLFRKSLFDAVGGYAPELALDDWSILLRVARRYRIAFAGRVLARYRIHSGNMSALQSGRLFLDTVRILLRERAYCEANGLERTWWEHAGQAIDRLTVDQLEGEDFLRPAPAPRPSAASPLPAPPPAASCGQRIHLHALCWNDARMLPFFFRHYDPIVQRYFIYDDGSTDDSLEILRGHPRVELRSFRWAHPESFVLSELAHYDSAWKESRGEADWVFVLDLDEHLQHADLGAYLRRCSEQGVTAIPALGFEMVTDDFPAADALLTSACRAGAPSPAMSKLCVFSPDSIRETGYAHGGHQARPLGHVVLPPRDELLLLHYKHLGLDYTAGRYRELSSRLGESDRQHDWAHHWTAKEAELRDVFEELQKELVTVPPQGESLDATLAACRWWDGVLPRLEDREKRRELESRVTRLETELERQRRETGQLEALRASSQTELEQKSSDVDRLQKELVEARHDRTALLDSWSWRLTRPLRDIAERLGLFRRGS